MRTYNFTLISETIEIIKNILKEKQALLVKRKHNNSFIIALVLLVFSAQIKGQSDTQEKEVIIKRNLYERDSGIYKKFRDYVRVDVSDSNMFFSLADALKANPGEVKGLSVDVGEEGIPREVFRFTELEYLTIIDDYLKELPKEISKLKKLKYLVITYCTGIEKISDNICELKQLRLLEVTYGSITKIPDCIWEMENLGDAEFVLNPIFKDKYYQAARQEHAKRLKIKLESE